MKSWTGLIGSLLLACFAIVSQTSCQGDKTPKEIEGWKPVYDSEMSDADITSTQPQAIVNGGKIYTLGTRLYQVEDGQGIHVLDLSDPAKPVKLAFINIPGAHEISIKGEYLYSNNYDDLVVIDISNLTDVKTVKRLNNMFQFTSSEVPPDRGYFECVDPSKGKVVDWERTIINSPKCKY